MPNLYVNKGKILTWYNGINDPILFPHNTVLPEVLFNLLPNNLQTAFIEVENFWGTMSSKDTVHIDRNRAMGDLLMLRAILKPLMSKTDCNWSMEEVKAEWQYMFVGLIDFHKYWEIYHGKSVENVYYLFLNGVLEQDHCNVQSLSRLDLYCRALGIQTELDFADNFIEELQDYPSWGVQPYIVVQGGGSGKVKTLSQTCFELLLERLLKTFPDHYIMVIDRGVQGIQDRRLKFYYRLNLLLFWDMLRGAAFLVSQDSAPLWISHYTKTPVLGIFGATLNSVRLNHHPLYPKETWALQLNDMLKCPPCNERAESCEYLYKCMGYESSAVFLKKFVNNVDCILQEIAENL